LTTKPSEQIDPKRIPIAQRNLFDDDMITDAEIIEEDEIVEDAEIIDIPLILSVP
jgi:hypothetical protein